MATTFDVIYLGNPGIEIDVTEGNTTNDQVAALLGSSFGTLEDPLFRNIQSLSPVGSVGAIYDVNNSALSDRFRVDGTVYITDGVGVYTATLTYMDGTTATVTAKVLQATSGDLFLVPELASDPATQAVLGAAPIRAISFDSLGTQGSGLTADRPAGAFDNGVTGTDTNNTFTPGTTDSNGTPVTAGNDVIDGRGGGDFIDAGGGNDTVYGGAGNDVIFAGTGDDVLFGELGNDFIDAQDGNDSIFGGLGDDNLRGGDGTDQIQGGDDNDYLEGGLGNDTLLGDAGDDDLRGNQGDDLLIGGDGNDQLWGNTGSDVMIGGAGDDLFLYDVGDGLDTVSDFNANPGDNDALSLTGFYDNIAQLRGDFADDGVFNQSNAGDTVWGQVIDYSDNQQFLAGQGLVVTGPGLSEASFSVENTNVVCFDEGTLISTPRGLVPIQDLRVGDMVQTRDNGPQRLLWVGARRLGAAELAANPHLRPIVLRAAYFGLPRDLVVSPQHGILLHHDMRGGSETFYRAKHLAQLAGGGARVMQGKRRVRYFHLLFEDHQVVFANGMACESLYPGAQGYGALSPAARAELAALFPDLGHVDVRLAYGHSARSYAKRRDLPQHLQQLRIA